MSMNSPTKGYKATYNYKCRGQHFEIGQTYKLGGKPILCKKGFHFCSNMSDVLKYYDYKPKEFKLLEIEAVGSIVEEENKSCTNKIKIIREVPKEEWDFYKVLPNGHYEIHYKSSSGFEKWTEYDERENIIHFKESSGYEYWFEYNERGKVIHYKDSNGYEHWSEYDERENIIHFKESSGYEYWKEYNEKGNEIHYKDSYGFEYWKEYNENGNVIHYKDSKGFEKWKKYDENGNVIHYKDSDGYEEWY